MSRVAGSVERSLGREIERDPPDAGPPKYLLSVFHSRPHQAYLCKGSFSTD
jgi:hypothetical protein